MARKFRSIKKSSRRPLKFSGVFLWRSVVAVALNGCLYAQLWWCLPVNEGEIKNPGGWPFRGFYVLHMSLTGRERGNEIRQRHPALNG